MSKLEKLESLAKRRGFFYPSSEIYGGLSGTYDYGSTGTLLKRKIEELWRNFFLDLDTNFLEIEPANIMSEKVFVASGHLKNFVDPVARCKKCKLDHRADHLLEDVLKESFEGLAPEKLDKVIKKHKLVCISCRGQLEETEVFNMTFPLKLGARSGTTAYLRPETAQGVYIDFLRQFDIQRKQLPLGLAIVGKAFRNEISPRNSIIRQREFTQAELQIFINPDEIDNCDDWNKIKKQKLTIKSLKDKTAKEVTCENMSKTIPKLYIYYMTKVQEFYFNHLKIPKNKFRFRQLSDEEKAFYNKIHFDVELNFNTLGWKEISGVHYRTDYDLSGHQKISKKKHEIFYNGKRFIPHVIELSFGIDRLLYSILDLFYDEDKIGGENRTVLRLPSHLSPYQVAVFPLVKKDGLKEKAEEIFNGLKKNFETFFDISGSIGKRYRRMDEIGTILSVTIDYDTLKDETITLRDRDSTRQIRVPIRNLTETIDKIINGEPMKKFGKFVK